MNRNNRLRANFASAANRRLAAFLLALAAPVLVLTACRQAPPSGTPQTNPAAAPQPEGGQRLGVFVSIPPQAYFVQRVGGDHVQVDVLVGPGQNPHSFEPTPAQISSLAKAAVFFRVGMPFEDGLLPRLRGAFTHLEIVDTRQGVPLRPMEEHEHEHEHDAAHHGHEHDAAAHHAHEHGSEAHHEHPAHHDEGGADPHIWLNPRLVKIQAHTIADALIRLDPANADEYRSNLAAFAAELDALHARIAAALAPVRGQPLFVYHPAFGYFADAYGLHQVPVEIGGKEPSPKDLAELIRRARQENVRVIFVQPQFSTRSAEIIARQIGGAVVPLDDLAPDYMTSMETMAEQVRQALSKPDPQKPEPAKSEPTESAPEPPPTANEPPTGAMPKPRSGAGMPSSPATAPAEPHHP